jgi:hypothetical protein
MLEDPNVGLTAATAIPCIGSLQRVPFSASIAVFILRYSFLGTRLTTCTALDLRWLSELALRGHPCDNGQWHVE